MPYTKQEWIDNTTTISAQRLNHIEDGIEATDVLATGNAEDIGDLQDSIAEEFSTSKSYAVGDYVMYEGSLYIFTSAHAAGAWSSGDVEEAVLGDDVSTLKSQISELDDDVYCTTAEVIEAENLYEQASEDLMLAIGYTAFEAHDYVHGFYIPVSEYRGKTIIVTRDNTGYILMGVFSAQIPAVGVTYSSDYRLYTPIKNTLCATVPSDANYLYILYYNSQNDTTYTQQELLSGMTIKDSVAANGNLYDNRSEDINLSFNGGAYASNPSLYGFYVPIDTSISNCIRISRTNQGARLRSAASVYTPAVGVSYTNYASADSYTDFCVTVSETANYLYLAYYNSDVDTLTKEQCLAGMTINYYVPNDQTIITYGASRIGLLSDDIADEYSAAATYAVGDYCIKDTILYKCITAITTAEAFNAEHWSSVSVTDEILSVGSGVDNKVSIAQGVANAGRALVVGNDGNVTPGDDLVDIDNALNAIDEEVYTTETVEEDAPNLFNNTIDVDLHLGIGISAFENNSDVFGFYLPISEYQGKNIVIFRDNAGKRLRGAFSANIPAVGTSFVNNGKWNSSEKEGLEGKYALVSVPEDAVYLYVMYYNPTVDTTYTKDQLLSGLYIGEASQIDIKEFASDDVNLSFESGSYGQMNTAYGFYIDIHDYRGKYIYCYRSVVGKRFRYAFSNSIPAVGVTYTGYSSYDNNGHVNVFVPNDANYIYVLYYNSAVDTLEKNDIYSGISMTPVIPRVIEREIKIGRVSQCVEELSTKVDEDQGVENAGKTMMVDENGTIVPVAKPDIEIDRTLEKTGEAADAKAVGEQVFTDGCENLFKNPTYVSLGVGETTFETNDVVRGFYIPIDPSLGSTITIRRTLVGTRFRAVSCANIPAAGITYLSTQRTYADGSNIMVYDKARLTDRYLYILYGNTSLDTLTNAQLLAGMAIYYGTEYTEKLSRMDRLDYSHDITFENATADETGAIVDSTTHIISSLIKVDGRFCVSCPADYIMSVYFYDNNKKYLTVDSRTGVTTHFSNAGYIRIDIAAADSSAITPSTVDFSEIKFPGNRYSAYEYAKAKTIVIDAENSKSADVYAYLDKDVSCHGMYATKTYLCTETSGLPVYYYTLGSGAKKACIVAGQHGDGSNGDPREHVITTAKLMHDLMTVNFADGSFLQKLHDEYTLLVIPILNVYGFDNNTRTDANSVDTNRDWVAAATTEVAAAKSLIASFNPSIALDVHTNGTTPTVNSNVEIQFGFGTTHNPLFKAAIESYFNSYYNVTVQTRSPNADTTLDVYINTTLGKLGGILELRWWLKDKLIMHDWQAESCNYAMLVNSLKYLASVNDNTTFVYEHTPNQIQY